MCILTVRSCVTILKCVLRCCAKFPIINLPDQETDDQYPDTITLIRFHIYHIISCCTKHGRLALTYRKCFCKCQQDTASGQSTKIYTRKELLTKNTTISNFIQVLYSRNSEVGVSPYTRTNTGYK